MPTHQRRRRILELISHTGFTTLVDLASAVNASPSTVRRDLDHWERKGLVKRSHGGATYIGDGAGLPELEERVSLQSEEKRLIARLAAARQTLPQGVAHQSFHQAPVEGCRAHA